MKTIGSTNDGGYIVEMTHAEHKVLAALAGASDGLIEGIMWARDSAAAIGYDLANPMEQVIAYTESKAILNQLKDHLDVMERALDGNNN